VNFDIVIAGGGFAGAYCARALGRALGRVEGCRRVALIAERNILVFQPMLAEVVGSALQPTDVVHPLREFCRNVTVLQGAIQRVDWAKKELVLDGGRFTRSHPVGFTHLVLALGSVTDLTAVPGLAEYGWPLKNVADALRLRATLINRLEEANLTDEPAVRARLLTFVVVGGGYTGVETAGQIYDFVREVHKFYTNLRDTPPRVVLVHSRGELLAEIGADLGGYARRVLEKRGIEVKLNTHVCEVTAARVHFAEGGTVEAHTIISTIGNAPNPVVLDLCRQLGLDAPKGRVPVAPTMRVPGHDNLWVAGDCAAVPWDDRGEIKTAPPTSQFALREGQQLGQNLARVLRGEEPVAFRYRYQGQLASIGQHVAVAEVWGWHFRGFFAWWLWRTIYLSKLPGTLRKLRVVTDWTLELFFPRDLAVVFPAAEDVLRSVHLEAGEPLFRRGDAARAFACVRRGSVTFTAPGEPPQVLPSGSVLDQDLLDATGAWRGDVTADQGGTDLVIFRGRALDLLRGGLKLVRR
jgi:NADH dehydrogenase